MSNVTYIHCAANTTTNVRQTTCQAIIVPCSADGRIVQGSNMAQIVGSNKAWLAHYRTICTSGQFKAGNAYPLRDTNGVVRVILLAIKQRREDAPDITYVEQGMRELLMHFRSVAIRSIATVKVGCNRNPTYSLNWGEVGYILASYFESMGIRSEIYIGEHDPEIYPLTIADEETVTIPAVQLIA